MTQLGTAYLSRRKKIFFTAIVVVLFLVAFEGIFRIVVGFRGSGNAEKMQIEPYREKSWTPQYFQDAEDCRKQNEAKHHSAYARFLTYDTPLDCVTPTLNYGWEEGELMRKTWNPVVASTTPKNKIYTIGMFGGSTLEGVGAIDDETIPSWFSKLLNGSSTSRTYLVKNYGVSGYTFTQSLMKLILLLREGRRFDYVILYGGANDIDNAYDNGQVGALFLEGNMRNALEGSTWSNIKGFLVEQINACATCRALVVASRNLPFFKDRLSPFLLQIRNFLLFKKGASQSDQEIIAFAKGIADYYKKSHDLLDVISKAYGFKYHEFWQPTLINDAPVRGESLILNIDPRLTDDKVKKLYALTVEDMRLLHLDNFSDLTDILKGRKEAYYLDGVHISGDANRIVAARIEDIMKGSLSK